MANQIPPSLKPTKHFIELEGKREVFGRCRTGHGFIGEYYSKFAPSESTDCTVCGDRFQTREHILKDYPEYEWDRDIALPTIMGTKNGFSGIHRKVWRLENRESTRICQRSRRNRNRLRETSLKKTNRMRTRMREEKDDDAPHESISKTDTPASISLANLLQVQLPALLPADLTNNP
ncbi:hypothetical protein C8J56DRAFT_1168922 [Mycena floridula]|nr:hypothetical protein C8J56DRAFT_1168922 [Mycena floridula]